MRKGTKRRVIGMVLCAVAVTAWGEPQERGPRGRPPLRDGRGPGQEPAMILDEFLNDDSAAAEAGLSAGQITTLKEAWENTKEQQKELKDKLRELAISQARLMQADVPDEEAILELVGQTGDIRTEIAKIRVKNLVLVKRTLTRPQLEKVGEMVRSRLRERYGEMKEPGHRGGARREGRRPGHAPDDSD